jgi:hypothetical protein
MSCVHAQEATMGEVVGNLAVRGTAGSRHDPSVVTYGDRDRVFQPDRAQFQGYDNTVAKVVGLLQRPGKKPNSRTRSSST